MLPMPFLPRLNEISEKTVPVTELFWSNLKFLKNDRFNYLAVRVECESEWDAISIFLRSRL